MNKRTLLLTGAIAAAIYAGGNHGYDFTNEYFISKTPGLFNVVNAPAGLDSSKVPLFISLGFDDNKFADGVDWVRDTLLAGRFNNAGAGNKATYDGTPMSVEFNVIGNADYEWSENPFDAPMPTDRPVTEAWRRAYDEGIGINNHTWTHNYNLYDLGLDDWKNSGALPPLRLELGFCQKYLVNILGMPNEHIYGFRTPYLASSISDNASFQVTRDLGILFDCTLDNGMQGNQPADWAFNGWPGMMNDGWGPYTAVATKGLWQIPNAIYQVTEGGTFSDKGFDSGPKGWPGGASAEDMFKQMKSAIDWSYNKNRAPIDLGLHSDYYSNEAQNTAGTAAAGFSTSLADRHKALEMLLDYIETELPDARVVNKVNIIRWMRNPVELSDNSRNDELTFGEGTTNGVLAGAKAYTSKSNSSSEVTGNSATVTVVDSVGNWLPDAYAGLQWNFDGSMEGTHSIRVKYQSDIPLRLMFVQSDMPEKERGYYGIGLPTTLGETKTVELPLTTHYFEPPRPYEASTTLDLAKVTSLVVAGQAFDTTLTGTFSAEVELFGGDVITSVIAPAAKKEGIQLKGVTTSAASITVPSQGEYRIDLFSLNGQKLYSSQYNLDAGEHRINWNAPLAKGIYLTQITGNGKTVSLRQAISQ